MMYKHASPPVYEIRTPSKSYHAPPSAYNSQRYMPAYAAATSSPYIGHARHASYDTYISPQQLPRYMMQPDPYATPLRVYEQPQTFASQTDRLRSKIARKTSKKTTTTPSSSKKERISVIVDDFEPTTFYEYRSPEGTPPPPYHNHSAMYDDPFAYDSSHKHSDPPSYKTRTRAASSPQKPSRQPSTKARKAPVPKETPKATAKDAAKAGIPAGYSLKNWDPDEEPILLLGSVFDANTLGKWIYDWTVFHHGAGAPMADNAGELWLSLIELASKMKRSEGSLRRIKRRSKREVVEDFIDEGHNLLERLDAILRACEDYMWKTAQRENGSKKTTTLGSSSGCAFVDTIFGRDRELETTEKLMADMRYWTHRFNTLCEPILRRPRD